MLADLWLAILLSAVAVFLVSSLMHMLLPYHNSDLQTLPDEESVRKALGELNIPPGEYAIPRASSMKEMNTPGHIRKLEEGPVGLLHLMPNGVPSMTGSLIQWFIYSLLVGFFAAYVAAATLPEGAHYLTVFRVTGTVAFAGYGLSQIQMSVWWKRRWSVTAKYLLDALVYGLVSAGVFGWLWP